jgi:hypothetical protein
VEGAEGGGEADASQTPAAGAEGSCVVISFFSENIFTSDSLKAQMLAKNTEA